MKQTTLARLLPFVLFAASAFAQDEYTPPDVRLQIQCPEPGATYSEGMVPHFTVTGPRTHEFEIEVHCFQTTHHLLVTPRDPQLATLEGDATRGVWRLRDLYLLPQTGEQICTVRFFDLGQVGVGGERRLLRQQEIPFVYAPISGEEFDRRMRSIRGWMIRPAFDECAHHLNPRGDHSTWRNLGSREQQIGTALSYVDELHEVLVARVEAYARAGDLYDMAVQPGQALRALRTAKEIYDQEAGLVVKRAPAPPTPIRWKSRHWTNVPQHHRGWARFYGRRKELDRSVHYLKEEIAFYVDQVRRHPHLDQGDRDRCLEHAAHTMLESARLHYLLRRDRAGFDHWLDRYYETHPDAAPDRGLRGR